MQLQVNDTIFHNWKIKKVIGEGSFGIVYEIEREEFGRRYKAAAKVISIPQNKSNHEDVLDEGMTEENVTEYYRSLVDDIIGECDLMERMKGDSHIVSYEDHHVEMIDDGLKWTIYIRMELLKPLVACIKENTLRITDIIQLGIDICRGLETCQKFKVIHRDIKPENIFVSDTNNYKLGDFGISKVMERSEMAVSKKGTQMYMAPEVYRGEQYDATVDIYSLGIVLFRLMNNNRTPFLPAYPAPIRYQDKETALQKRLQGDEVPKPCNASEEFASIIQKACSFRAMDRYQTPQEMRKDLEELLELELKKSLDPLVQEKTEEIDKTLSFLNSDRNWSVTKEEERRKEEKYKVEEEAKRKAEEEARRQVEEEAKRKAEEEARRQAEEEVKRKAEAEARRQAEEAKRKVEEETRRQAEEEAKRKAEEEIRRQIEEEVKRKTEEEMRKKEEQRRKAEEEACRQAEEMIKSMEEKLNLNADDGMDERTEVLLPRKEISDKQKADIQMRRQKEEEARKKAEAETIQLRSEERQDVISVRNVSQQSRYTAPPKKDKKIGILIASATIVILSVGIGLMCTTKVPDLKGLSEEEAKKQLEESQLTLISGEYEFSDEIPANCVITQDKSAGGRALKNSEILVVFSKGPEDISMPDLMNKTQEEAEQIIVAWNMNNSITVESGYSKSIEAGKICAHVPALNEKVTSGADIIIYVSQGAGIMPNVKGMTLENANNTLAPFGFNIISTEVFNSEVDAGLVVSQSIAENESVESGMDITIEISKGAEMFVVPPITGLTEEEAINKLVDAGYKKKNITITREYSDIAVGLVISQNIAADTQVEKGSKITICVSQGARPVRNTYKPSSNKNDTKKDDSGWNWEVVD